jgi:hypothetical protein
MVPWSERREEGEKQKGKSPLLLEEEAWVVQVGPRVVPIHPRTMPVPNQ